MAVSANYRAFILEQLARALPEIRARAMFGGVGVYSGAHFFALMDNDTLFFKVDDVTRPDFVDIGMPPFRPFGDGGDAMQYYEVSAELIEDHESLRVWAQRAVAVARRAKVRRTKSRELALPDDRDADVDGTMKQGIRNFVMRHTIEPALAAIALPWLVACAAIHRPPTTVAQLQSDAVSASLTERSTRDSVVERLVRRATRRGDRTLDVLMLSGGGQNGSYGVGFLRGWQSRPDAAMPRFDLVTGISTGALQAPYALLGTSAAMDSITSTYARAATEIAPTIDWFFFFRRTGGVVNTARFDRTLEKTINGQFRDNLRTAFAEDRQLVFGTSDYDLAVGRTWSLGETLDTSTAALNRARTLLKAATAIPGIFPPVIVDRHVHGDGGIISNVLTLLSFEDYKKLGEKLAARGIRDVTVRVWVIMNVWTHPEPAITKPSSRTKISARSNAMLFYAHMPETLSALTDLSRAVSSQVPGMNVELKIATLPAWLSTEPGASDLFDKAFMQRLDDLGFAKARSATPWDSVVPSAYARPPRGN